MSQDIGSDLLKRITSLSNAARDAEDAWRLAIRQRDELIVEAVDQRISQRSIAHHAGISKGRIIAILGNSTSEHVV